MELKGGTLRLRELFAGDVYKRQAQSLLEGLYLHLNILREQYPGHVKATKVENQ